MNRVEILKEIIRQDGDCDGIKCITDKCPLHINNKFGNGMCGNNEENLKTAKEMLAKEGEKDE